MKTQEEFKNEKIVEKIHKEITKSLLEISLKYNCLPFCKVKAVQLNGKTYFIDKDYNSMHPFYGLYKAGTGNKGLTNSEIIKKTKTMKKIITLEEYKKGNIAVNTRTQKEYNNFKDFLKQDSTIDMAETTNHFNNRNNFLSKLCLRIDDCGWMNYSSRKFYLEEGCKIITPNQLKEYIEYMGKTKYITKHSELLKLHGRSVTCKINGEYIKDAKISVDRGSNGYVYICQDTKLDTKWGSADEEFGYKYSFLISRVHFEKYEKENRKCTEIKLKEENENLTIGQAIDYMLESEENIIEYVDSVGEWTVKRRMKNNKLQRLEKKYRGEYQTENWVDNDYTLDMMTRNWTKIRKHIEPKTKSLKELIENKETFEYKNNWYRFNKDGAILDSVGSSMGIDFTKEILATI